MSIFKEYDGNPEATASAFDAEGFFRTGDRVTLLEDGWIKFSDRASDIIKVGGEGVSPSEIESVVRGVPGVRDVAVVAAEDATYGQVPVAFVEAESRCPAVISKATFWRLAASSLAKFKVPRRVVIMSELPRVGNAKIAKSQAASNALIGLGLWGGKAGMRTIIFWIIARACIGGLDRRRLRARAELPDSPGAPHHA